MPTNDHKFQTYTIDDCTRLIVPTKFSCGTCSASYTFNAAIKHWVLPSRPDYDNQFVGICSCGSVIVIPARDTCHPDYYGTVIAGALISGELLARQKGRINAKINSQKSQRAGPSDVCINIEIGTGGTNDDFFERDDIWPNADPRNLHLFMNISIDGVACSCQYEGNIVNVEFKENDPPSIPAVFMGHQQVLYISLPKSECKPISNYCMVSSFISKVAAQLVQDLTVDYITDLLSLDGNFSKAHEELYQPNPQPLPLLQK